MVVQHREGLGVDVGERGGGVLRGLKFLPVFIKKMI